MRQFLRSVILALVRILGMPGARSAQRHAEHAPTAPRILLVRPDHLGDMVMVTPILHALKAQAPDAHITMMVGPWSREIVARHPTVDAVITCEFPGFQRAAQHPFAPYTLLVKTARQLRAGSYDMALNLRPDFWWGAALLYLACIPRRLGYAIQPGTPFLTQSLATGAHEHATISNLRLTSAGLQTLGYATLEEPYTPARYPACFVPTEEEDQWVATRLEQAGITPETPIVVIHPGTGADVKLWRPEGWAHVADILAQATTCTQPVRVILSGSPKERALLEQIAQGMQAEPVLLSNMSVGRLAALLKRASLVLGVDSGPLHLAVPQQHPTVRIFGPTDARIFGPWGDPQQHRVIAATQRCPTCPCIPCGRLDFAPDE
ncbi:MAG TPA: glycosyltransferase family 9 protein, partial [Ktedonobacteraceae bacterium]|nr:glycosyltransferase family 9 protein [Ktedonobacteraceae bacterium]